MPLTILETLSQVLDPQICTRMIKYYEAAKEYQFKSDYSASITNFGKFLELVARAIYKKITGNDTNESCGRVTRKIANSDFSNKNVRVYVTNAIDAAYAIRNGRDAAHSSITIDTNQYDCVYVSTSSDWILGELLVELCKSNRESISKILNSIVNRRLPLLFEDSEGKKIVLTNSISAGKEALIKLYSANKPLKLEEIMQGSNMKRTNMSVQLGNLTKGKLVSKLLDGSFELTPLGINTTESIIADLRKKR